MIGIETVVANTFQAWSQVLDVVQDPKWGRYEETYGEDPIIGNPKLILPGYQQKLLEAVCKLMCRKTGFLPVLFYNKCISEFLKG